MRKYWLHLMPRIMAEWIYRPHLTWNIAQQAKYVNCYNTLLGSGYITIIFHFVLHFPKTEKHPSYILLTYSQKDSKKCNGKKSAQDCFCVCLSHDICWFVFSRGQFFDLPDGSKLEQKAKVKGKSRLNLSPEDTKELGVYTWTKLLR